MGKKPKSHSRYPSANKSGSSERKSSKDAPNLYSKTVASEDPRRAQNLLAGCIFDGLACQKCFCVTFAEMELSIFVQSLNPQNYAASVNGCSKRLL